MATTNDNMTLYAQGGYGLDVNSYATMQMTGHIKSSASATLYLDSVGLTNRLIFLSVTGADNEVNSYAPLIITGGTAGSISVHDAITLYMPTPLASAGRPLFIKNTETSLLQTKTEYLFIEGSLDTARGSIPLYLLNDALTASMTLFIRTPSGKKNYIPFSRGIPLFINRPDESIAIPLFLKAVDNVANSYTTLYTRSAIESTDSITLAMPNIQSIEINTYATLMVEGVIDTTDSITLVTDAHGTLNATMNLMLQQETGFPNSYINLFTAGAYLHNDNITLVMPATNAASTDSMTLYVLGW